jgi:hypothetical protein
MNTEGTKNETNAAAGVGRVFYIAGWAVFVLSILFALSDKTAERHSAIPFWVCFGVLAAVSAVYLIGCLISARWRSKVMKRYFSSYLLGACGWVALFLLFRLLDRFAG